MSKRYFGWSALGAHREKTAPLMGGGIADADMWNPRDHFDLGCVLRTTITLCQLILVSTVRIQLCPSFS